MNDTLEKALATIINNTTNAVGAGISFLSEQIPDVVRQLLLWEATKNGILCFASLLVATFLLIIATKLVKKSLKLGGSSVDAGPVMVGGVFLFVVSALPLRIALDRLLDLLQIIIAPKIFLITYAATLIKGN